MHIAAHPTNPEPELRARTVHRAAAELRRGTPVRVGGLIVLSADTASAGGLAEMTSLVDTAPVLVLSAVRASAVLRRPVGGTLAALHTSGLAAPALRGLADPTADQILPEPPVLAPTPDGAAAAIALLKIARLLPAALVAPVRPDAELNSILSVSSTDVLAHPAAEAAALVRVAETIVPLEDAPDARVVAFRSPDAGIEHLAIVIGRPELADAPLVRIHSECFTGDLLGSLRCDCGPQLRLAIRRIAAEGTGAVLYLAQEGRGIGLVNKLRAYAVQDRGLDTLDANRALGFEADERNFLVAAVMLGELGIRRVRLLTNNPAKVAALTACGVDVAGREPLVVAPNGINDHYLATKVRRLGHEMS